MKKTNFFGSLLSTKDIIYLKSNNLEQNHPLKRILFSDSIDSNRYLEAIYSNTKQAVDILTKENYQWLVSKKIDLLSKDNTSSSGALGEIRCYGSLLSVFGTALIKPVQTKKNTHTPDFLVTSNGESITIEVNTIQMNGNEAEKLRDFNNQKTIKKPISIRETSICPFGNKKQYSTTETVINKLSLVKNGNKQFSKDLINVLWIDLQDEMISIIGDRLDCLFPIMSNNSCYLKSQYSSNEIWYSLYAKKGTTLFESVTLDSREGNKQKLNILKNDGRFISSASSIVDAIVYNSPKSIVICENPNKHKEIPDWFLHRLMELVNFKAESSKIDFPKGTLKNKIASESEFINQFSKFDFYSW